jgi:hypothetical protein
MHIFCGIFKKLYYITSNKKIDMAKGKKEKVLQPKIKVKLDRNTIIYVKDEKALEIWLPRYPDLKIVPM